MKTSNIKDKSISFYLEHCFLFTTWKIGTSNNRIVTQISINTNVKQFCSIKKNVSHKFQFKISTATDFECLISKNTLFILCAPNKSFIFVKWRVGVFLITVNKTNQPTRTPTVRQSNIPGSSNSNSCMNSHVYVPT